jgi:hypothetical protein
MKGRKRVNALKKISEMKSRPHGDLPKIPTGHRQENEAHDGRCIAVLVYTESSPDFLATALERGKAKQGRRNRQGHPDRVFTIQMQQVQASAVGEASLEHKLVQ